MTSHALANASPPRDDGLRIPAALRDNLLRMAMGAAVASAVWVWTAVSALQDAMQASDARYITLRDEMNARYLALRERTDATAVELHRRMDRLDQNTAVINAQLHDLTRVTLRIESRISPNIPPP